MAMLVPTPPRGSSQSRSPVRAEPANPRRRAIQQSMPHHGRSTSRAFDSTAICTERSGGPRPSRSTASGSRARRACSRSSTAPSCRNRSVTGCTQAASSCQRESPRHVPSEATRQRSSRAARANASPPRKSHAAPAVGWGGTVTSARFCASSAARAHGSRAECDAGNAPRTSTHVACPRILGTRSPARVGGGHMIVFLSSQLGFEQRRQRWQIETERLRALT
eukprot:7386129-Prymnesium_polylepis.1